MFAAHLRPRAATVCLRHGKTRRRPGCAVVVRGRRRRRGDPPTPAGPRGVHSVRAADQHLAARTLAAVPRRRRSSSRPSACTSCRGGVRGFGGGDGGASIFAGAFRRRSTIASMRAKSSASWRRQGAQRRVSINVVVVIEPAPGGGRYGDSGPPASRRGQLRHELETSDPFGCVPGSSSLTSASAIQTQRRRPVAAPVSLSGLRAGGPLRGRRRRKNAKSRALHRRRRATRGRGGDLGGGRDGGVDARPMAGRCCFARRPAGDMRAGATPSSRRRRLPRRRLERGPWRRKRLYTRAQTLGRAFEGSSGADGELYGYSRPVSARPADRRRSE